MKRKLLWITLFGAFSISSPVNAAYTYGHNHTGFFGGVSAGISDIVGTMESTTSVAFEDPFFDNPQAGNLHTKGHPKISSLFSALLGYGYLYNNYYLGAEVIGSFGRAIIKDQADNSTTFNQGIGGSFTYLLSHYSQSKVRNFEVALDLTPGFLLFDSYLLYGRAGVGLNRLKLNSIATLSYSDVNGNVANPTIPLSAVKQRLSLRLGIGLAHHISENLVLNANYLYAHYGKITVNGAASFSIGGTPFPNGLITSTRANISRQTFSLGLNYFFANL